MWKLIPDELKVAIDNFLQEGYKAQDHSGGWFMVRDAKKQYLKAQRIPDIIPAPRVLYASSRGLVYTAKRQQLIPACKELKCDWNDGTFSLTEQVVA